LGIDRNSPDLAGNVRRQINCGTVEYGTYRNS
jgi:hypothetical protein